MVVNSKVVIVSLEYRISQDERTFPKGHTLHVTCFVHFTDPTTAPEKMSIYLCQQYKYQTMQTAIKVFLQKIDLIIMY